MASRARSPSATRQAQLGQSPSADLGEPQYHDQTSKVDFSSFTQPIPSNGSLAPQYEQINSGLDAGYPAFVAPVYDTHVGSGTSNYADQALSLDPMAGERRVSGQMQPAYFQGMGPDAQTGMNGSFEYSQSDLPASALDPSLLGYSSNSAGLNGTASTGGLGFDVGCHLQADMLNGAPHNTAFHNQSPNAQLNNSSDNMTSNMTMNAFPATMGGRDSLDPSAAMFPQQDWTHLGAYRNHVRTPSDNISELSSHSNQASPYIGTLEAFDNSQASPLLNPSHDSAFLNDIGLHQFTLAENLRSSPAHSPGHSPRISPQPSFPPLTSENMFGMTTGGLGPSYPQNALETFPSMPSEAFPPLNNMSPNEYGAADQVSPPEIAIDFAPPTMRLPQDPQQLPHAADNSLSPPLRTLSRNRMRAKSDSYAGGTRPQTPGIPSRGRSPSLQPRDAMDNLSPFDHPTRSPSLDRGRTGSLGNRSRSASNLSDHRDQVLAMAHPERTPSNGADNKRVQKHPATFQCNLCPKRFTRAYNLRSHLRTHTDERPFKCTVCNKAFARQHDRKRHEGLHSGEKKFVCRGNLQNGASWGCGRRFARADALGRHFRSEAGRVCIKPLLDEEAAEKRKWADEQQQARFAAGMTVDQSLLNASQMDMMANMNFLPAAILQQYPALAQIDWGALQHTSNADEYDGGGRSSFDASSGGEFDLSEAEMSDYPDAGMGMLDDVSMDFNGQPRQPQSHLGGYGSRTGDYLSDFDGR